MCVCVGGEGHSGLLGFYLKSTSSGKEFLLRERAGVVIRKVRGQGKVISYWVGQNKECPAIACMTDVKTDLQKFETWLMQCQR